jgi:hypothetical protein
MVFSSRNLWASALSIHELRYSHPLPNWNKIRNWYSIPCTFDLNLAKGIKRRLVLIVMNTGYGFSLAGSNFWLLSFWTPIHLSFLLEWHYKEVKQSSSLVATWVHWCWKKFILQRSAKFLVRSAVTLHGSYDINNQKLNQTNAVNRISKHMFSCIMI